MAERLSWERPLIIYPDPVKIGVDFLRPALAARTEPEAAGALVVAAMPSIWPVDEDTNMRRPMVVLLPGGGISTVASIDRPRLDVRIWHSDQYAGAALAQLVRGLLHTMAGRGPVRGVREFLGPTYIPDPETGAPRYLLTVELTVRGVMSS